MRETAREKSDIDSKRSRGTKIYRDRDIERVGDQKRSVRVAVPIRLITCESWLRDTNLWMKLRVISKGIASSNIAGITCAKQDIG